MFTTGIKQLIQDTFFLISYKMSCYLQQRVAVVEGYQTRECLSRKFPDAAVPVKSSVQKLAIKWYKTGSVTISDRDRIPTIRILGPSPNSPTNNLKPPTMSVSRIFFMFSHT